MGKKSLGTTGIRCFITRQPRRNSVQSFWLNITGSGYGKVSGMEQKTQTLVAENFKVCPFA
jgi:hypothetical protein